MDLILGFGVSGKSAASLLLKRTRPIVAIDDKAKELLLQEDTKVFVKQGLILQSSIESFVGFERLIVSPGISPKHPIVLRALEQNFPMIGEVELGLSHLNNRCIAVTGTNGKSTTTMMIAHVLNTCGIPARAIGNIGCGVCSYACQAKSQEVLVIELSSFQIETLVSQKFDFAVVLNVSQDHLDRYSSLEEYERTKQSLIRRVKDPKHCFFPEELVIKYREGSSFEQFLPNEKYQNVQATFAICKEFGITESDLRQALKSFRSLEHRMEKFLQRDGVTYINDSKATNVESVFYAMQALNGPIILIVGGVDKGASYVPWIKALQNKVKQIVAYGQARHKIMQELSAYFPIEGKEFFSDAVFFACEMSEEFDTVILSPGCSSFDQFQNYAHRGSQFKALVEGQWIRKKQF